MIPIKRNIFEPNKKGYSVGRGWCKKRRLMREINEKEDGGRRKELRRLSDESVDATRRAPIARFEASSPAVAFVVVPVDDGRDVASGRKQHAPLHPLSLSLFFFYFHVDFGRVQSLSLSSYSTRSIVPNAVTLTRANGNPFPQTKGPPGPSTSIFFPPPRLVRARDRVYRAGM